MTLGILIALLTASPILGARGEPSALVVVDMFGRRIEERGLILVDLEGPIANPVARVDLRPPPEAAFPATSFLSTAESRLYFDLPSEVGPRGSHKEVSFRSKDDPGRVQVSLRGDRDGEDEEHEVKVRFTDATGRERRATLPVHVIDQDRDRPPTFRITVDFGQDRTGFFRDAGRRRVVEEAASDWAYFLEGGDLEPVGAGAEATWIWEADGFRDGAPVRNGAAYTGFLLYAYGVHTPELRSGGEPSWEGGWLRSGGRDLPVRRSGGLEIETAGNFNGLGWLVLPGDEEWWRATNRPEVPNDLLSIAHHEIGHSLFFNPANPVFAEAKRRGKLVAGRVRAYLGRDPEVDGHDHFPGAVDPISRKGVFGNEYFGDVPRCRWIVTKLDLLLVEALGHRLRETSAFRPLEIAGGPLPPGEAGRPYRGVLRGNGGIPSYDWGIAEGGLPEGLELDRHTGEISGTPRVAGRSEFVLRLRESIAGSPGVTRSHAIEIRVPRAP